MTKPKPGKAFEALVGLLERSFQASENTTVESNKRLPDRVTGEPREFDVLVTFRKGHNTVVTAFECKDYRRTVDVAVVETLRSKMQDCGIHRGVVVASNGFTSPARAKAAHYGIGCMTLTEAMEADWLVGRVIPIHHRQATIRENHFGIRNAASVVHPYKVYTAEGEEITPKMLNEQAHLAVQREDPNGEPVGESIFYEFDIMMPGFFAIDAEGTKFEVTQSVMLVEVTNEHVHVPLQFHTYEGEGASYSVASADWSPDGKRQKIIMIREGETLQYGIVPAHEMRP